MDDIVSFRMLISKFISKKFTIKQNKTNIRLSKPVASADVVLSFAKDNIAVSKDNTELYMFL